MQDQDSGELITHLKLQKLLYYAQGYHLALYGEPLFAGPVEAWEHGPVVREVWDQYKGRGAKPIGVPKSEPSGLSDDAQNLLEKVYAAYAQYSAWKLRDMTHRETPWKLANKSGEAISEETMEAFFRARLQQTPARRPTWREALADARFTGAVDEGLADVAAGRTLDWTEVERSLPSA